jgi:hypothetical protein
MKRPLLHVAAALAATGAMCITSGVSAAPVAAPSGLPLTPAQLGLAGQVLLGDIGCDMNRQVRLWPVLSRPGHFELRFGKAVYTLVPHQTATGAVRLEDAAAGVVWLQIPAKSMLLDARKGRRLADGCMHMAQHHEQADRVAAPSAAAGLGIVELQR